MVIKETPKPVPKPVEPEVKPAEAAPADIYFAEDVKYE